MANTILVGAQWGDEGKGKIIDVLTEQADVVVRTQGGNNAGHTVLIREQKYVLHLIPSGILRPRKTCVIGNGVVVDPVSLVEEIEGLRKLGDQDRRQSVPQRNRAPGFSVSPRTGRPARNAQGQKQNRHHQARHRPGLRRQGGAHRLARD